MKALELRDIWAGYGRNVVLNNFDWSVDEGDFWAVVGPNGSGKTTLLRLLIRALYPTMGDIRLFDKPLREYSQKESARIVACIQQTELHPANLSVLHYALMGRYAYLKPLEIPGKRDVEIATEALGTVDALELQDRSLFSLSSGEFQRAMVARALAQEPKILAIDEPTAHQDLDHTFHIMELLKRLNESGMTVLVVLHDLNLALRYATKALVIWDGTPRARGYTEEVFSSQLIGEVFHVASTRSEDGSLRFEPMESEPPSPSLFDAKG
jgi:iron complex transport system ATP-binding protein